MPRKEGSAPKKDPAKETPETGGVAPVASVNVEENLFTKAEETAEAVSQTFKMLCRECEGADKTAVLLMAERIVMQAKIEMHVDHSQSMFPNFPLGLYQPPFIPPQPFTPPLPHIAPPMEDPSTAWQKAATVDRLHESGNEEIQKSLNRHSRDAHMIGDRNCEHCPKGYPHQHDSCEGILHKIDRNVWGYEIWCDTCGWNDKYENPYPEVM